MVGPEELALTLRALSPVAQARARLTHDRADADGDGSVSSAEARDSAEVQAQRGFSDKSAQKMRDILTMDMDGNARVGLDEIAAIIVRKLDAATLAAQPGQKISPRSGAEKEL